MGKEKIKNLLDIAIAPEITQEILDIVKNNCFSMAIDEWTDNSNKKWLAIVFRILKGGFICSAFFDLI